MIESAEQFVQLRCSNISEEYHRAALDEAPLSVWLDVIATYPDMKKWVVHNKTIPMEILEKMAADDDVDVRYTVATKRKLNPALLELLSEDFDASVRCRIAINRSTPKVILERLANDFSELVSEAAKGRLGMVS